MITVLVANPKGGCGKTTIATNLASAFAGGGLRTALADADRQRSSTYWLKLRPAAAPPIEGLNWAKGEPKPPADIDRLVIDGPAGLRLWRFRELVAHADVVIVPILPSPFDERTASRFVRRILRNKAIRKRNTPVGIVRNRVRVRTRAADHLETVTARLDAPDIGEIRDRTLYMDVASKGLGIFDLPPSRIQALQSDWYPLIRFIETAGWRGRTA